MTADVPVRIFDTTLRDGTQAEDIAFTVEDKLRIAEKLDVLGIGFIEGGWPGSNPKDIEFFAEAKKMTWTNAKLAAFGSTRHKNNTAAEDPFLNELVRAETEPPIPENLVRWCRAALVVTETKLVIQLAQHSSLPQEPIPPILPASCLAPICLISIRIRKVSASTLINCRKSTRSSAI